jgi:hypothetical protein
MREEELRRGDPIRPLDWHETLPFEAAAASDRLGWVGLEAARYREPPASEIDLPPLTHHTLILFARPPEELDLQYEGVKRHMPPPPERSYWCRPAARPCGAGAGPTTRSPSAWSRGWWRGAPPRPSTSTRHG